MTEHTPTPWTFRDVSGAGLEICAPVYKMSGVDLPRGMPEAPIHVFQFTSPQMVQVAAERWVQFEPTGWSEMQEANAAFIVKAVNNHEDLVQALQALVDQVNDYERVNNLAPNPGRTECWDTVARAKTVLAAANSPANRGGE